MVTIVLPMEETSATDTRDLFIEMPTLIDPASESMYMEKGSEEMVNEDEPCWEELYPPLKSLARYLVNTLPLPYWRGREADIVEDITQETMRRLFERLQKARRGEAPAVQRVQQMMNTIACNYYRDLKRHERRLLRLEYCMSDPNPLSESESVMYLPGRLDEQIDLDSIADKVDQEALFYRLAKMIGRFPKKQRRALLIDLANRMAFDQQPTVLQMAFLQADIEMQHYQQPLPTDPRARTQHISLLSQAYKHVSRMIDQLDQLDFER